MQDPCSWYKRSMYKTTGTNLAILKQCTRPGLSRKSLHRDLVLLIPGRIMSCKRCTISSQVESHVQVWGLCVVYMAMARGAYYFFVEFSRWGFMFKGEVRSKIKLSHFVEFGALIRMVLVRGASEQPFLRYSNFKDYQIWESLFMSR